jgi:phage/plasmid-like protein (TIGR03299 family)
MTTGKAAMAYIAGSATPWHNLGFQVAADATIADWQKAGGLEWEAKRADVFYQAENDVGMSKFADKSVLYRSDTNKPLSVVSKDYNIVQPADILNFFSEIAKEGHFSIETVGSLKEGRRIWALARVGENARIMDDQVAPYLLLATSFDGTMATIGKFTSVRVVCNNTLQASLSNNAGKAQVNIPHSALFKPEQVRAELGIAMDSWEEFKMRADLMAHRKINPVEVDAYLQNLLEPFIPYGTVYNADKVKASRGYQSIMTLFTGKQIGTGQDAIDGTLWGILNASTQYVDWEKGKDQDNRLNNAWFGTGAKIKDRAYEIAQKMVVA